MEAELAFHLEELTERLVREGAEPAAARAEAERRFGDYGRIRAACVDVDRRWERHRWWRQYVADLWQDLRVGARALTRTPGFTVSAVIVLGLGIGVATAAFSVVNAVFIRPLPFPESDRIVSVVEYRPSGATSAQPQGAIALLRDRSRAFSALAGVGVGPGVNLVSSRGATYVRNREVTAGFFRVLGIEPSMGRSFSRDDEAGPPSVVLSHGVWTGHFGRDPNIIGAEVRLGGRLHTVIGVMPSGFRSFEEADAWTPFRPDPRGLDRNYQLIARLRMGWTVSQAEAELQALSIDLLNELRADVPEGVNLPDTVRVGLQPYRDVLAGASGQAVWLLSAAVGVMLLIVCANAAGLQLARAVGRRRELAVRAALGAGRERLFRQLLTESVLLSTIGGAVGAMAAAWGVEGLVAQWPRLAPWDVTVNLPVLCGAFGLAVATGLLFGLMPGVLTVRGEPADALQGGPSRSVATGRGSWLRGSLVVAQVALCTLLLSAAAVFLRTFVALSTSDLGFDPANVLTARASLQGPAYESRDAVAALYQATLMKLAQLPGVEAAAATNNLPVERGLNLAMRQVPEGGIVAGAIDWRYVAGDYLRAMRIPLVAGRAFRDADHRAGGEAVALVNETFARRFGGGSGRPVIGTRLQMTAIDVDDRVREVVGVLGDVRTRGLTATQPTVYVPVEQVPHDLLGAVHGFFPVHWVLRTRTGGTTRIRSVERIIQEADPLLPIVAFQTMNEVVGGALAPTRFGTLVLSLFAGAGLALAAAGLYGLVAYSVAQRTREIGIRLALGASGGQVTARFARSAIALASVGGIAGAGAAIVFAAVLRRLTADTQPLDVRTLAGVVLVLCAVSVIATVLPARQGTRVDPLATLRAE